MNVIQTHYIDDPQPLAPCRYRKSRSKCIIKDDEQIKDNIDIFIQQLQLLKTSDQTHWINFLVKWKLCRIFHNDNFNIVWNIIKSELNLNAIQSDQQIYSLTEMNDEDILSAEDNDSDEKKEMTD